MVTTPRRRNINLVLIKKLPHFTSKRTDCSFGNLSENDPVSAGTCPAGICPLDFSLSTLKSRPAAAVSELGGDFALAG
jgi:hypothetical protein